MISLLFETHVHGAVTSALRREGVDALGLQDWRDGQYRNSEDDEILEAVEPEGRVFVSYDRSTIEPLLRRWADGGRHHSGVILVNRQTIASNDIGALLRALRLMLAELGEVDWRDRVVYLPRPPEA